MIAMAADQSACKLSENSESSGTLLVFSDDWGRHPSSCQHLVKRLLARHEVIWVNTIGMRPPRFDLPTVRRGLGKMAQWLNPQRRHATDPAFSRLSVLNPIMWPWMTTIRQRSMSQTLLLRQLRPVLERAQRPIVGVTTIPFVVSLIGHLPVDRWTYYCVDDFTQWPGLDGQTIRELEDQLILRCDDLIAASTVLQQRAIAKGRHAALLTHGVDLPLWSAAGSSAPKTMHEANRPRILFFGLIDERLDREWLTQLDASLEAGSITLVGPCQASPRLARHRHVRIVPPVAYDVLPAVAAQADVLVMPYIDAEVTRAMQPLKLLEYLATDKPVVVRNLPATNAWADCLDQASTAEDFVHLVRLRLETGLPVSQRIARERLCAESWESKAEIFRQQILGATS